MNKNHRSSISADCQARSLYLDLMKRCLTNWIYADAEARLFERGRHVEAPQVSTTSLSRVSRDALDQIRQEIQSWDHFDPRRRTEGLDWPPTGHTMIGLKRLDNLQACVEDALANNVPGDLIETGVWRGGATIFMRAILKAYGVTDRVVWVADSFEGLPAPNHKEYPDDFGSLYHFLPELSVSLEQVQDNFERYGLLDDQARFLKGWFKDTLPTAPIERLAVVRMDGDMYQSTMEALVNLYPKLSIGGYLIVDDYGLLPPCRRAVEDYRRTHGITEEIIPIDSTGVYWQRSR
ncbi:MAG: TylF/MycF family methyltransferase [Acidobacteria bacterium]|nr:TylF/MycF family methyltransferase [Acidobacteriota bacterium]